LIWEKGVEHDFISKSRLMSTAKSPIFGQNLVKLCWCTAYFSGIKTQFWGYFPSFW